jgi:hypothetical protein
MTMPESVVTPPVETPALFGLLSAARLLPLTGHDEFGVQYDVVCDNPVLVWPGACRPVVPTPAPVTRTITVTLTGTRTGSDPTFTYTIAAKAVIDGGPPRMVTVTVDGQAPVTITTGLPPAQVYTDPDAGTAIGVVVTDTATDTEHDYAVDQDATTGAVTPASEAFTVEDPAEPEKLAGTAAQRVVGIPFGVYGVETCLMGVTPEENAARARARLALIEQPSVERAFWTGEYGNSSALATSDPEILANPSTTVDLTTGLSLLEQWLGEVAGAVGFIHTNRGAAPVAAHNNLINRVGARAETEIGNVWVFGGGYPTTGPAGQAAPIGRELWMFASRQPTIRRTEVIVPGDATATLNWSKNSTFTIAERIYVIDFPCQTAAVKVDLSKCLCGGA